MPNQIPQNKRRQSFTEHPVVLAALATIAARENTTVLNLLRAAARQIVRTRATAPAHARALRSVVWQMTPRIPARLKTAAQLARFKRAQREFDQVLLDLQIASPGEIQARNSIVQTDYPIRILNFATAHLPSV
jgi:hypothetical protein